MVISVNFNGKSLVHPNTYSKITTLLSGGLPVTASGVVGIIGEASKGAPGDVTGEGVQSFNSTQLSDIAAKYSSGPIVDAAKLLIEPSRDARLVNGAQIIRVWKTNSSVQSTLTLANVDTGVGNTMLTATSGNYGVDENNLAVLSSSGSVVDAHASVVSDSDVAFPIAVATADTLIVVINGITYTLTVTTAPGGSVSLTQAQWVTLLNGAAVTVGADTATPVWAPSKPVIASASGTVRIQLVEDPTVIDDYTSLHEYGLMTLTAANIRTTLALGVASAVNASTLVVTPGGAGPVRGSRGSRVFTVTRNDVSETIDENSNDVIFSIRYVGASTGCLFSVSDVSTVRTLVTTTSGPATPAEDLNLNLNSYTVQELVDYINNFGGGGLYTCVTSYFNASVVEANLMDYYRSIDILTLPLNAKAAINEIVELTNEQSQLISVEQTSNVYGQLRTFTPKQFLTGASTGGSTNTDFQDGFDAILAVRCNTVIPLISQDATTDITDGLTDANSTYDIASVNLQADTHCRTASNTQNRSERNCIVSLKDSFVDTIAASKILNSEYSSMTFEDTGVLDINGTIVVKQPWAQACLAAGMMAGAPIGEPITFKYANCYSITHSDFNSKTQADSAIKAGLLFLEQPDQGGFRFAVGNTTYQKDGSFVYNRISVFQAAQYVAYDLRQVLENIFIGTKARTGSAENVKNVVISAMAKYLRDEIIVGDDLNSGLGWRNLTVVITGPVAAVDITITPVEGLDFILPTINLDQIRQTA